MSPDNDDTIKISPEEELEAFKRYFNETKPPKNCYETQKKIIRQDSFGNDVEYMVLTVCDLNDNIIEERTVRYDIYRKELAGEKTEYNIPEDPLPPVPTPPEANYIDLRGKPEYAIIDLTHLTNIDITNIPPDNTTEENTVKKEKKKNTGKVFLSILCVALPVALILLCMKIGQNYIGKNSADKIKIIEIITEAIDVEDTTEALLININTATAAELTALPGIGEAKAKKIVAYREANGDFGSIEEIKNVSGIGDATFENIKSYITVGSVQSANKNNQTKAPETEKPSEEVQTKPTEQTTAEDITEALLININTADVAELDKLPGIGEATAKKIIAYREQNGNFKSIEDIMNVSGIAEKKFEKLKDYITVEAD